MTDTTPAVSLEARRATLVKALRKYRNDGYEVTLSADGLTATLTRRKRISALVVVLLALVTVGLALIYFALKASNRKTESIVLYVDERGKVLRA